MMNQNMNVDSIQKQMEEMEVFGTQPTQPDKLDRCWQPTLCHSNLPSQGFFPDSPHYADMHASYSSDWEIFEAVKIQELEEVKARAAQMEKTMRWWSDCTANWREKWSKVRGERNKAREEARQLRIKLDSAIKELSVLKKLNQDLASGKGNSENGTAWKTECCCSERSYFKKDQNLLMFLEPESPKDINKIIKIPGAEDTKDVNKDQRNDKNFTPNPPDFFTNGLPSIHLEESKLSLGTTAKTTENDLIHVSVLNLHLSEMRKFLQKEREMNVFLEKEMEKMENELFLWKWKYEELRQTKLESLKQLERMQCKNASEWGERKQLEAEKQSLEEETRKLKMQSKKEEEREHRVWNQTKFLACCWRFYHDSE
ncbi:coiled-coil domain-containing protein 102B isoform X1 [Oenanthe melanoleuca]|uniref:coiled-coil domain-containing protein 102B isoform X1 n=1 Tax=Oenanthe melanoleuca TaxID=2939378 RepID=UPI0024C1F4AB|nr:coiled-coil domain-containing protein 102B isoform X1 [Oenanthe melanoleuca]XP_056341468.1 coiled-coil domain-containing protein 102B isoform X1 [Oenanthe melanoleuca]XP_056341469.1 coiled-coil domain-containing protein 102B isoform X1 [Oenanthe melanoleuca]XP_056341470.1 coiled-coil domain-containing protein 102B isoform X1 [Oenanthe melanoleuca]